ncbi:MAG: potassium channel family protein [Phycisphaerales bacterium]
MYRFATAAAIFLFLFVGGLWVSLVRFVPDGLPRDIIAIAMALLFAGVFVWFLVERIHRVYSKPDRLWLQLTLALANLVLLIFAFGVVYTQLEIVQPGESSYAETRRAVQEKQTGSDSERRGNSQEDLVSGSDGERLADAADAESMGDDTGMSLEQTNPDSPEGQVFWTSVYFSVVTFATLGYGDLRPVGIARVIACIEAMIGYLVLGLLASTSASILQWSAEEKRRQAEEDAEKESGGDLDSDDQGS